MRLLRLFLTSRRTIVRAWALGRDARVPKHLKILAALGALLILSPLNLLGDIPLIGFFDDVALIGFLLSWFVRVAGPYAFDDIVASAQPGRQIDQLPAFQKSLTD
ncbi:MAG TPA: hypothetical protein VFE70_07795 [Candidatus Elarobacter sp.]|nr:hypothetical protein [Candidatus Elarobacter sp.]